MAEFFQRVEKKYILNSEQYNELIKVIESNLVEDEHGRSTIYNIYFDSDEYDLIKHSIDKSVFKDKIRLRSYNVPNDDSKVFLEIKRKYDGIVSKRRIKLPFKNCYSYIDNIEQASNNGQVEQELKYYFKLYKLKQKMFVSYNRKAFYDKNDKDFRITLDSNIIARDYDLKLEQGNYGTNILEKDNYIMEIKTLGAIPIWFVKYLDKIEACPSNFSKYGEAYKQLILEKRKVS